MNVLVDTSVWSLALRRDVPPDTKEVQTLSRCLERQDVLLTTGIIVQELLQGFRGPKQRERIIEYFSSLSLIVPDLTDYVEAATLQTNCRRKGIQIGTIDALLAQLAIGHDLELLTTDRVPEVPDPDPSYFCHGLLGRLSGTSAGFAVRTRPEDRSLAASAQTSRL